MVSVSDVFNAALALMDELSRADPAQSDPAQSGTADYAARTPAILDSLVCEFLTLEGDADNAALPLEALDDPLLLVPDRYARGVLPYGLAAHLLADENPNAASFLQQRYEELRDRSALRRPATCDRITDIYGFSEMSRFGRW